MPEIVSFSNAVQSCGIVASASSNAQFHADRIDLLVAGRLDEDYVGMLRGENTGSS